MQVGSLDRQGGGLASPFHFDPCRFSNSIRRRIEMNDSTNARWLRWLLTGITVLLAIIAIELSTLMGPIESRAWAQIPDSGMQRKQQLDAQEKANSILEGIFQHLRTQ